MQMVWSAGDLGIEIDFGLLYKEPGAILQRKEKGYWHDYLVDGAPVTNPFDVETLLPGCGADNALSVSNLLQLKICPA